MSGLISILVPIYNVEKYLDKCVNSVLNQTYKRWEMILVDDGSTDKSGIISDEYAKKDSRIRVYHKKNEGLLRTRQFTIPLAYGDYCVFLDSDDYLSENALEVISKIIEKNNYDCIVYGYRRMTNDNRVVEIITESSDFLINEPNRNVLKLVCNSTYNPLWRKAVKTDVLKKACKEYEFVVTQTEDLLQSIDIFMRCTSVWYIHDVLYNYRVNLNSVSYTKNILKKQNDIFTVRSYVLRRIIDSKILNNQEFDELRNYYVKIYVNIMRKLAENMEYTPFQRKAISYSDSEYYNFINMCNNYNTNSGSYRLMWMMIKRKYYRLFWSFIRLIKTIH